MSKIETCYIFHEVEIDKDGNETEYYESDLPHGKEIVKRAIED